MTRTTVLVTGVGGGGFGEQILKALRLADRPYEIVGTDITSNSNGFAEVDYPCVVPSANHPKYVEAVLRACERYDAVAVFPGSEPEMSELSRNSHRFVERGLLLACNPPEVLDICLDKVKTAVFLTNRGFCVPRHFKVCKLADLDEIDYYPVVLKPSRGGGGSVDAFLAQDQFELSWLGRYLLARYSEFIVQEYVGLPTEEYTVGVLSDMNGELVNSIALRRNILTSLSNRVKSPNRTVRDDLGPILALSSGVSQGEFGIFPHVTKVCERISLEIGARGPINIQCRVVGNSVYVFEINPRFSGTTSLRAMVGFNEPDVLLRRHLYGETITPHFGYRVGYVTRGLHETLITPELTARVRDMT